MVEFWTPTLAYYSKYKLAHIKPIMSKIARIVSNVQNSKFKAIYKRYLDLPLARVAALPQLKGPQLLELTKQLS